MRRRLLTTLEDDGSTPAAEREVRLLLRGARTLRTDAHGVVRIDPAPVEECRLEVGMQTLGPVQNPAGATEHSLMPTLPASK